MLLLGSTLHSYNVTRDAARPTLVHWMSYRAKPRHFLELPTAGATLAETEGIDDLILGRLLEMAPVAVSVPWGFEKFDGIARGVLYQDLLAAPAADDLVAQVRPRLAQGLNLASEIVDL